MAMRLSNFELCIIAITVFSSNCEWLYYCRPKSQFFLISKDANSFKNANKIISAINARYTCTN